MTPNTPPEPQREATPTEAPAWTEAAAAAAAALAEMADHEMAATEVAEVLLGLLDAEGCAVWRMRPQAPTLSPVLAAGEALGRVAGEMPLTSIPGRAAATQQPLLYAGPPDSPDPVRDSLCVPLRLPDGSAGVLEVVNKRDGSGFSARDLEAAFAVAPSLVVALSLERRSGAQRRALQELQTLVNVGDHLNRESDPGRALEGLLKMTQEIVGAEAGFGLLFDSLQDHLRVAAGVGRGAHVVAQCTLSAEESLEGLAARRAEPAIVNDPASDGAALQGLAGALDFPVTSLLCVPLRVGEEVFGVVELVNASRVTGFGPDDARLLTVLTDRAAAAIRNSTRLERLKRAFILTVECLSLAFESPNPESQNHPQRTVPLAKAVAGALGLSALDQEIAVLTTLLHDVGKLAIDQQLMQEPRQLTERERAVVRAHPLMAALFLEPLLDSRMSEVVEAIEHHHEWFDGRGYPDGLEGDRVPVASRVIAVVHAYCAMTEGRPYQAPKTPAEAIEELRRWTGSQFDARVVEALVAVVQGRSAPPEGGEPVPAVK